MTPKPINDEPEQYNLASYTRDDKTHYRVRPVAPGKQLDKWDFVEREPGRVVLVKHIGGEKYHANHTVPDAVPLTIKQRLDEHGLELISPDRVVVHLPRGDYYSEFRVDEEGQLRLDEKANWVVEQIQTDDIPDDLDYILGDDL